MNSMWLAGLLTLVLAPFPSQDEGPEPDESAPASSNIRGAE